MSSLRTSIPTASKWRSASWIVGLVASLVIVLAFTEGAWLFQLEYPYIYDGDGLSHAFVIKSIMDQSWFPWHNRFLAAPFTGTYLDYPSSEGLFVVVMKLIALFTHDWVTVLNTFYIVGFVLVAVVTYWVLLDLDVDPFWAVIGSLLFTLLPFHFFRVAHLFLSFYIAVPLAVWLALSVSPAHRGMDRPLSRRRLAAIVLTIVVVGSSGVYYAFFGCFLILVAGAAVTVTMRSRRGVIVSSLLILGIAAVVLANTLPSIMYRLQEGPNAQVATRFPEESEVYGLKLTQLLLPRPGHRLPLARLISEKYNASSPYSNENATSSLGAVASIGFLLLLAIVLLRLAPAVSEPGLVERLATLNVAAVLLGTVGGIGALFAYLISPMIRGYNRISVFIAFISLAGLMVILQAWSRRGRHAGLARWLWPVVGLVILVCGAIDQTSSGDRKLPAPSFASDRAFVRDIEASVPAESMIYQLPYHPYPEVGPEYQMEDYGLFRGYLHSRSLRWSYGAMRGRADDRWLRALSRKPLERRLAIVAATGFAGLYVDRRGIPDAKSLEAQLAALLGTQPRTSQDGNLLFYAMKPTGHSTMSLDDLSPPVAGPAMFATGGKLANVTAVSGLSDPEPWGRWTVAPLAIMTLDRPLPRRVTVELTINRTFWPGKNLLAALRVGGQQREFRLTGTRQTVIASFDFSSDVTTIELLSPSLVSPKTLGLRDDPRPLGIGVESLVVRSDD